MMRCFKDRLKSKANLENNLNSSISSRVRKNEIPFSRVEVEKGIIDV
jgi:hypothetical protein